MLWISKFLPDEGQSYIAHYQTTSLTDIVSKSKSCMVGACFILAPGGVQLTQQLSPLKVKK